MQFSDVNSGVSRRARSCWATALSGPSDVAQNLLQYATYLGFSADWLPLLRLALAWMLPTDDNSLWEIMLGGSPTRRSAAAVPRSPSSRRS